jgi:hypothetical protein
MLSKISGIPSSDWVQALGMVPDKVPGRRFCKDQAFGFHDCFWFGGRLEIPAISLLKKRKQADCRTESPPALYARLVPHNIIIGSSLSPFAKRAENNAPMLNAILRVKSGQIFLQPGCFIYSDLF